jgi:hypothetical protein
MCLPDELPDDLNTTDKAWELLAPWGRTPDNTDLERHAVYSFAARWADRWNVGRLIIAGDAAHLMPPFAGQGMCSGIRDAANLAWKLDRVLRRESEIDLLDSYTSERSTHLQHAITMSVELGKVICVLDEDEAARRDERMIAAEADPRRVLPVTALPVLGPGVTAEDIDVMSLRGTLLPQFRVAVGGTTALLDDAIGPGAVLFARAGEHLVPYAVRQHLEQAGVRVITVGVGRDSDVDDPERSFTSWFDAHDISYVLVRPDRYVFGAVADWENLAELASQYRARLHEAPARVAV